MLLTLLSPTPAEFAAATSEREARAFEQQCNAAYAANDLPACFAAWRKRCRRCEKRFTSALTTLPCRTLSVSCCSSRDKRARLGRYSRRPWPTHPDDVGLAHNLARLLATGGATDQKDAALAMAHGDHDLAVQITARGRTYRRPGQ